jgi:hypothetical protein
VDSYELAVQAHAPAARFVGFAPLSLTPGIVGELERHPSDFLDGASRKQILRLRAFRSRLRRFAQDDKSKWKVALLRRNTPTLACG